jgi:hypothetical protein
MKKIKLTQNEYAIVDDEDFEKLNQYKWHCHVKRKNKYAIRSICKDGIVTVVRMHRYLMQVSVNKQIDHINGNGLDNRKENLRICTNLQNCANQRIKKINTSGFKGVNIVNSKGHKYIQARIGFKNKRYYLGVFKNFQEAAIAYDEKAVQLAGEFALTNKKLGLLN